MAQINYPTTQAEGCFKSSGNLVYGQRIMFDSSKSCKALCVGKNAPVAAMTARFDCWCGSEYPPKADQVSLSVCSSTCPGYDIESCGGQDAWTVWSTGILADPGNQAANSGQSSSDHSSSSSSSTSTSTSTTSHTPSVHTTTEAVTSIATTTGQRETVTLDNSTIVKTIVPSATSTSSSDSNSSSGSKVGVAVGVVVGVIALIAIIAGIYLFLRRKRRMSQDGHHRRNSSLNGFVNADRHPPAYALKDSRLDPTMVERRQSTDSVFADNQDYSRRILKVTNPDGS